MGSFRSYRLRSSWGGVVPPAIKTLLVANAGMFTLQLLASMFSPPAARWLVEWFGLVPYEVVFHLKIWQPFTYLFLHGGLWHLLMNMLMLWMFGSDLERSWGQRRFYTYYFLTGTGAGVISVAIKFIASLWGIARSDVPTIGASGAIFGLLLASAVLFPDREVWLIPFPVMLPMRLFVAVMGVIEFFSLLGTPGTGDNISHLAHLAGILVGYVYLRRGSFLFRLRNRYTDWKQRRLRRQFRVYMRQHRNEPPSRPDHWVN